MDLLISGLVNHGHHIMIRVSPVSTVVLFCFDWIVCVRIHCTTSCWMLRL